MSFETGPKWLGLLPGRQPWEAPGKRLGASWAPGTVHSPACCLPLAGLLWACSAYTRKGPGEVEVGAPAEPPVNNSRQQPRGSRC